MLLLTDITFTKILVARTEYREAIEIDEFDHCRIPIWFG